ncbi:MAG: MnhB domain-containing protein [Bacteroidales bacterium]|nr:MnhB domain-containing protein [Bacteroidales bacterium]MDZ4203783.1 MnhB domain-containing protein [Bacteroidales bacterium]
MKGMTVIVKKVTQLLCGIIFIFGIYIVLHGHLTPGGGFAGGTIIAGAFILLVLAYGDHIIHLRVRKEDSSRLESFAIFLFLAFALAGMFMIPSVFFSNYYPLGAVGELLSAGVIPLYNIFIGVEVAAALFTVFLAFVILKEEDK